MADGRWPMKVAVLTIWSILPVIGAVPIIGKDKTTLVTGETVDLTCTINGYAVAEWNKGYSAALTTCTSGGSPSCSPLVSDRYTFSTTQNTITVSIANLNRADDGTTWICYDAGAGETGTIVLDPIFTQQSGNPTLTESSECQTITCESSCIAPFASSDVSFTWKYIPDGDTAQTLSSPSTALSSSSEGCSSSEEKVKSTLTNNNKPTGFTDHVKYQCDFSQNDFTSSSWTATSSECFKGTTRTTTTRTTTTTNTTTTTSTTTTTTATTTTTTTPTPTTTRTTQTPTSTTTPATSTTQTTSTSATSTDTVSSDSQTKVLIIALPTVFVSIIVIAAAAFVVIWFRKHYMNKKPKSTVKVK